MLIVQKYIVVLNGYLTDYLLINKDWTHTSSLNHLKPNDAYIGRTAPLTSRRCILYIYSTNIRTEYFKRAALSTFFPSKCHLFYNATLFGSCIIRILHTGCAKI